MVMVSPSILAADFANLERDIHVIEQSHADMVHVDVMDGCFVPNISVGLPVVAALHPSARIFSRQARLFCGWSASIWMVSQSAPAFTKPSA